MQSIRLPRFNRSLEIAPMRLTQRDREILSHVHRHRFLRSGHVTALVGGSRQHTLRRLQLLYHHGYLERPRCQIDYYHRAGSRPIAYGLGNKGAGLLKRELTLPFHRLDWPRKNRVERLFLAHALMVSDFMVALEMACHHRSDFRLLTEDDMNPPDEAVARRTPFQWRVNIGHGLQCGVIPDRVFGLETADGKRTWYVLEADRGTMPVTRRGLEKSSFHRKLLAYEATWTQGLHRTRLGWQRFRVLTITTDTNHLIKMQTACRTLKRAQGLFLFTTSTDSNLEADFLNLEWQTCDGKRAAMMP